MIEIVNGNVEGWDNSVYIGPKSGARPGSPLGIRDKNLYKIENYKRWLWREIKTKNPLVLSELQRLKNAALDPGVLRLASYELFCQQAYGVKDCLEWMIDNNIDIYNLPEKFGC